MLKVLTKADWDESEHPRDEDGKFAFGGGGGDGGESGTVTVVSDHPGQGYSKEARIKDGKIFTSNVYDAARALHENRKVELDQPRTLSTLITHLGKVGNEMKARGEAAPNYNLCNVSIKGTNLFCAGSKDIPRPQMPQLTTEQTLKFRQHLKSLGYKEVEASERSDFLRATQSELNGVKVARVAGELRTQTWPQEKRLIVSRDNYILDGHHLWAAQIANDAEDGVLGDAKTDIARIDIDIITLMDEAKNFGAGYEPQNIAVSSGYGPEREMGSATPEQFVAARSESERAAFLSDKSADELKSDNLFLSRDGHTGYALDPKNDLQNLFNNGPKGGGKAALVDAIKNGAETLDAFDSFLPRLYAEHGFVVTGRIKFNDEFAPSGWNYARDGRPDIVFMRYAGGDRETIEDRIGKFAPYDRSQGSYFDDYDAAKAASRSAVVGKGLDPGLPPLGGGRAEHGGRGEFHQELGVSSGYPEEDGKRFRVLDDSVRRIYVRSSLVQVHRLISKIEASGDIEIVPYDGDYIPGTELIDLSEWDERAFDESQHPRGQPENAGQFGPGGGGGGEETASQPAAEAKPASTGYSKAETAALGDYINDSTDLNTYLRSGSDKANKEYDQKIALINSALSKNALASDFTLWRGISECKLARDLRKNAEKLVGQSIPLGGFQSTSSSEDIALEFIGSYNSRVVLEIITPKGSNIIDMQPMADNFAKQKEYLLGEGSLKIQGVTRTGRGSAVLYVTGTYEQKKNGS